MSKLKVYLAGPMFTQAERRFNCLLSLALEARGFDTQLPQYFCEVVTDPMMIAELCLSLIAYSDVVVLNCDGADVESGTAFEAGYARGLGMPIIAYRTDYHNGGDQGLWPVNLMIGSQAKAFIVESNYNNLIDKLAKVLAREESRS